MGEEMQLLSPENLPLDLGELGMVTQAQSVMPGVYDAILYQEEAFISTEAFIVLQSAPDISDLAKKFGVADTDYPELLVYRANETGNTRCIIDYELMRYKTLNQIPLQEDESMRTTAAFGMEMYPEYFGAYPVPVLTPWGYTTRHKAVANGVFWLETDSCRRGLAISFPLYDDLSNDAMELACHFPGSTEADHVFFSERDSYIPIFELLRFMNQKDLLCAINPYALMNALYLYHPEYVTGNNIAEQAGFGGGWFISFTPQSGTEFITF